MCVDRVGAFGTATDKFQERKTIEVRGEDGGYYYNDEYVAGLSSITLGGIRPNGCSGSFIADALTWETGGETRTLRVDDPRADWVLSARPSGFSSLSYVVAPAFLSGQPASSASAATARPLHIAPNVARGNIAETDGIGGLFDEHSDWKFVLSPVGDVIDGQGYGAPPILWAAVIAFAAAVAAGFALYGLTQSWAIGAFGGIGAMYVVAFMSPLPIWAPVLGLIVSALLVALVRRPWD